MNGLPDSFDPGVLVGTDLIQVCFGEHQLQLNFDPVYQILIEVPIEVVTPDGVEHRYDVDYRTVDGQLLRFISEAITDARREGNHGLRLSFSHGGSLFFEDVNERHESYQILRNGEWWIVV